MRKLTVFLFVMCYAIVLSAQGKFSIGPDISYTRANILEDHSWGVYEQTSGNAYGLSANYKLTERISLQSGLYYDLKGAERIMVYSDNNTDFNYANSNYSSEYITLPVLLRISTKGSFRVFTNAGFYTGYLLNYELDYYAINAPYTPTLDLKDKTNKFDAGVSLGVGVQLTLPAIKRINFTFELRDNFGLIPLENKSYPGNMKSYNNALGVHVGVSYNI